MTKLTKEQIANALNERYSSSNALERIYEEGIKEGNYNVRLFDIREAKNKSGKPIIRMVYELTDPYELSDGTKVNNIRIQSTYSNFDQEYNGEIINFARDQVLLSLLDINKLEDDDDEVEVSKLIERWKENKELVESKKAYIRVNKLTAKESSSVAIFYTVFVNRNVVNRNTVNHSTTNRDEANGEEF